MPEVKGKSGERRNATLDLNADELIFKVKPGMIRGKGVVHRMLLGDIVSLESKTGIKPYPEAQLVLISHTAGSVEFFTENKDPLREIVNTISENLEARALKLMEDEALFEATRESHVALIVVNLELIDSLMDLVTRLSGSVDWELVETELIQTEAIIADRVNVPIIQPAIFSAKALRNGVEKRLPYVIKQEVHDILSLVSNEAAERSSHLTAWFPSDFHRLFIGSLMTLWNRELAVISGVESVEGSEGTQSVFDSLQRAVVGYTGDDSLQVTSVENMAHGVVRSTLYRWTDLLLGVPFSQDKE